LVSIRENESIRHKPNTSPPKKIPSSFSISFPQAHQTWRVVCTTCQLIQTLPKNK
jgi:hypothetical protein